MIAALASGCFSTRTVAKDELRGLHRPVAGDGAVLRTTSPWRARLDPRTWMRLRNHQDQWTDWLRTEHLRVDDHGVWVVRSDTSPGEPPALAGWPWHEVGAVQVQNVSGPRLLGGLTGTIGTAIAMAPLALLVRHGSTMSSYGGPSVGDGASMPSGTSVDDVLAGAFDPGRERGAWVPTAAGPASSDAPRLFSAQVRRRSLVSLTGAASLDVAAVQGDLVLEGGVAGVRLYDIVELGAGGLHLATRTAGRWDSTFVAFGRGALVLPVDAARRVTVPLTLDVGAGGHGVGGYVALRWGVRIRLPDRWYLGIQPLNATYLSWDTGGRFTTHRPWAATTGLELGRSF